MFKPSLSAFVAILVSSASYAAEPPTAGQILNQIEKSTSLPGLPKVTAPKIAPAIVESISKNGQTILLKGVRFTGNTKLNSESLLGVIKKFISQQVSIEDLALIADLLTQHYVRSGFLANVTLPEQDITNGVVLFKITEARLGRLVFNADQIAKARVPESFMTQLVEQASPKQALIEMGQIDRSMLLLDDLSSITVGGGLQAGQKEGESDLAINIQTDPFFSGSVNIDNFGSRSTGPNRLILAAAWSSPFSRGGEIVATALKTEGTDYGRGAYSFPVGYSGLTGTIQASALQYDVITETKTSGDSQTIGAEFNYPYLRSYSQNIYLKGGVTQKFFKNKYADGTVNSDYDLTVAEAEIRGNKYIDGVNTEYAVTSKLGYVDLQGSPNYSADQSGDKTHGRFAKLAASIKLKMPVQSKLNLTLYGEGQLANKNLDSSEKMYLGGANGVRAYPESEGSGTEGIRVAADLEYRLADNLVGSVFVDGGRVRQNKTNLSGVTGPNLYSLKGYGFSATYQGPKQSQMQAIISRRIGNNPNPTSTGNDQSGDLKTTRFWLSVLIPF